MLLKQLLEETKALQEVYRIIAKLEKEPLTNKQLILDKLQYVSAVKVRVGKLAGEALTLANTAEANRKVDAAEAWLLKKQDYIREKQNFTARQLDVEADAETREKRLREARAFGLYEKLKNLRSDLEGVENTLKFRGRMLYGDWKDSN